MTRSRNPWPSGSPANTWTTASSPFPPTPGARAVIDVAVERIADSCGYAVPYMDLVGPRERLTDWAEAKGADGLAEYHAARNAESIDGLPGLGAPHRS